MIDKPGVVVDGFHLVIPSTARWKEQKLQPSAP